MRKICIVITLVIFVLFMIVSVDAQQEIIINIDGKDTEIQNTFVSDEGYVLVPVRAVSEVLDYKVDWNAESSTMEIKKDNNVLILSIKNGFYEYNSNKEETVFPLEVINGSTYMPLDVIAEAIGYVALWDNDIAYIITDTDNAEILVDFDIISKEDLNKKGYITNREAVEVLSRILGTATSTNRWYEIDILEPLDYIDEEFKSELLGLENRNAPVVTIDDIVNMDFESNMTNYEALVYVTRMVADTYGCTDVSMESNITSRSEFYDIALEKGLIDSINIESADEFVLRSDFYKLITRALFVERNVGGYVPVKSRLANRYISQHDIAEEEIKTYNYELTGNVKFNEDMSLSWELDDEVPMDCVFIDVYDKDGEYLTGVTTGLIENKIDTEELLQFLLDEYPKKADNIVITYYSNDDESRTETEKNFKIDLSNINIVTEGDSLKPGVYKSFERKWVPEYITLSEGHFKKGAYYILRSYEHRYRKEELNAKSTAIFTVNENTDTFYNVTNDNLEVGAIYTDDVHIQEVTITGNPDKGFTIHITPESEEKLDKCNS